MNSDDAFTLAWGLFPFVFAWIGLLRRIRSWDRFRDARSKREAIFGMGLAIAATASAISFVVVVLMIGDTNLRRLFAGLAYASFGASMIVWSQETPRETDSPKR